MMDVGNSLTILVMLLAAVPIRAWRSYTMEFASMEHESNNDYLLANNLQLIQYKGRNVINGTLILKKDLYNPIILFEVIVPRAHTEWTLMNVTFDGCNFVENSNGDTLNLPYLILRELTKSQQFPTKCPIAKNQLIYIEDFSLDTEKFPAYMPDMNFRSSAIFNENNDMVLKVVVTGNVQSKNAGRTAKRKLKSRN